MGVASQIDSSFNSWIVALGHINLGRTLPSAPVPKTRKCRSRRLPWRRVLSGDGSAYVGFWFHCSPNPFLVFSHLFTVEFLLTLNGLLAGDAGLAPRIDLFGIKAFSSAILAQLKRRKTGRFEDDSEPGFSGAVLGDGVFQGNCRVNRLTMPLFSRPVALDPGSTARCRSAPSYVFGPEPVKNHQRRVNDPP